MVERKLSVSLCLLTSVSFSATSLGNLILFFEFFWCRFEFDWNLAGLTLRGFFAPPEVRAFANQVDSIT